MEPTVTVRTRRTQHAVTAILVLILVGLIPGYIYYGMLQATPTADTSLVEETPPTSEQLAAAQRQAVLNALATAAPDARTPAEKAKIMSALETSSSVETKRTPAERQAILDALKSN